MTSVFLAQTASFVQPPNVDTVFQNGLKADWDVTITLQRDLNALFNNFRFAVPVANHGNEVNGLGDGLIVQGLTSSPHNSINDTTKNVAQGVIDSIKQGWVHSPSVMYDTSYNHLKDNVNKTTLRDNVTVALIALFTNGVLSLGDVRKDMKDRMEPPIRTKVRNGEGKVQSVGAIDISLLLPKGCSVIGGALDEWLSSSDSASTSWYNQVLVQEQVDEILADIVLFQRFEIYGRKVTDSTDRELGWFDTDGKELDLTINPRPTANGGGMYPIKKNSLGSYDLDSDGNKQKDGTITYSPAEMFGKLNLKDLDRIGVLVNLGYVLRDGRDMQIRLCLEQCVGPTTYSTQYDTRVPNGSVWQSQSGMDYSAQSTTTEPDYQQNMNVSIPSSMKNSNGAVTLTALQDYMFAANYVNFSLSQEPVGGVIPANAVVKASKIRIASLADCEQTTTTVIYTIATYPVPLLHIPWGRIEATSDKLNIFLAEDGNPITTVYSVEIDGALPIPIFKGRDNIFPKHATNGSVEIFASYGEQLRYQILQY